VKVLSITFLTLIVQLIYVFKTNCVYTV